MCPLSRAVCALKLRDEGKNRSQEKQTKLSHEPFISILTQSRDGKGGDTSSIAGGSAGIDGAQRGAGPLSKISLLMYTLHLLLRSVGMAGHAMPLAFRFGKILLLLGFLFTPAAATPPPTDWHWLLPSQSPLYSDVAHGLGTFVGVGGDGEVATSPDGLSWTTVFPGTFDYLNSVAFGKGTFVAGGSGSISISTDGTHWEQHPGFGDNVELIRIRYLGNLFVAIGREYTDGGIAGVLYTSNNGRQWTRRLRLQPSGWNDVYINEIAYGNGRFVVVGEQQKINPDLWEGFAYTSTDGLSWTRVESNPTPLSFSSHIAFGEAGFVLLNAGRILTSADGLSWQLSHQLEELDESDGWWVWTGLAAAGNRIVCLAEQVVSCPQDNEPPCRWDTEEPQNISVSSSDGLSWQTSSMPRANSRLLFSDGSTFVALAERSTLSSPDGMAWTEHFKPHPLDSTLSSLWDVTYGDQGFVAVGDMGSVISSRDGIDWVKQESGTQQLLTDVVHGGERYVAVGSSGGLIHSMDGQNWANVDLGVGVLPLGPLAHGVGRFVLFTRTASAGFWTSPDGMTWQLRFSDAIKFYYGISSVAFGNGRFVVTGEHFESNGGHYRAEVAVSEDGITWQRIVLPEPYSTLLDPKLTHDGNRFLAWGGRFGHLLLASPDGLVWTTLEETPGYLTSVGHGDGNLVAVRAIHENNSPWGDPIGLLDSFVDGSSWTTVAPFKFSSVFDNPLTFAYGAGRFVGVGRTQDSTARLLISGFTPPLSRPQLDLRREGARWMLRIRGAAGTHWNLQQSLTMHEWQTVRPVLLETEQLDIDVTASTEHRQFWRLTSANQ